MIVRMICQKEAAVGGQLLLDSLIATSPNIEQKVTMGRRSITPVVAIHAHYCGANDTNDTEEDDGDALLWGTRTTMEVGGTRP